MPPLKGYSADLPYSYAAGVFPSLQLMAAAPQRALRLLLSEHASGEGIDKLRSLCREHGVEADCSLTMQQLGRACGIAVPASAVAIVAQ